MAGWGGVLRLPTGRRAPVAWHLPAAAQIGWRLAGLAVCDAEGTRRGGRFFTSPLQPPRGTREDAVNIANGSLIGVISGGVRPREGGGEVAEAF